MCDRYPDCQDESDEEGCAYKKPPTSIDFEDKYLRLGIYSGEEKSLKCFAFTYMFLFIQRH